MIQGLPVSEQLRVLERLQELDLKIDNLKKNKSTLPTELRASAESLLKLQTELQTKKASLSEVDRLKRQTRAALDLNQDRLTRSNSRLELVQNSQEFQAINKEIDQLKKMNISLEEQLKKSDEETTVFEKDIHQLSEKIDVFQAEHGTKLAHVTGENSKLDSEISIINQERLKYSSQMEPRLLGQYDRVRIARSGLGIVPAADGRCKGCNMVLPPQLYNEIRKLNTIHCCPSCHRILFVPTQTPSTEEAAVESATK